MYSSRLIIIVKHPALFFFEMKRFWENKIEKTWSVCFLFWDFTVSLTCLMFLSKTKQSFRKTWSLSQIKIHLLIWNDWKVIEHANMSLIQRSVYMQKKGLNLLITKPLLLGPFLVYWLKINYTALSELPVAPKVLYILNRLIKHEWLSGWPRKHE